MNPLLVGFIVMAAIILIMMIATAIFEPQIVITTLNLKPKRFRLFKPKNEGKYYLQVRVFYIYYYIYKHKDDYSLCLSVDRYCLYYPNHVIISNNREKILADRYEIVKFFHDTGSPEDKINL